MNLESHAEGLYKYSLAYHELDGTVDKEEKNKVLRDLDRQASYYRMYYKNMFHPEHTYYTAWDAYKNGDEDALVGAADTTHKYVEKAEIIEAKDFFIDGGSVSLPNVYGYDCTLSWIKMKISVKWVKFSQDAQEHDLGEPVVFDSKSGAKGRPIIATRNIRKESFSRCVKFNLYGPRLHGDFPSSCWGLPGILEYNEDEDWIRSRLYLQDKSFDDEEDLTGDIPVFTMPDLQVLLFDG